MSRPSGGSMSRPSGGSSANRQSSGSMSRPSAGRPSGGSVSRPSASRPSGSSGAARRSGGFNDGAYGRPKSGGNDSFGDARNHAARVPESGTGHSASRPSGSHADRPAHSSGPRNVRPEAPSRSGGGSLPSVARRHADGAPRTVHTRPAPGARPYADGHRAPGAAPGRVHVNPRPGMAPPPRHNAPRELHGAPGRFHYNSAHFYGHYRPTPPPRYELRRYWGRDYYFWDDVWYRYYGGRYWVVRPPFGYIFTPLADAVYTACAFSYYFDRIHYYDTVNENASTIIAQNETIAANNATIAAQNETIARNAALAQEAGDLANTLGLVQSYAAADAEYFYNDGVFYVKGADGQYTVIVPPAGAVVESLPDDYETIELGGAEYYKVDDTVYRMAVIDGKACFEVLGQITK